MYECAETLRWSGREIQVRSMLVTWRLQQISCDLICTGRDKQRGTLAVLWSLLLMKVKALTNVCTNVCDYETAFSVTTS
jgi:hypothetical protein